MSNPTLKWMQSRIGQELHDSPSPLSRWLRGRLVRAEEGELTVQFMVREEMTNPMGILHGGMVAAIMDDIIGSTVFSLHHEYFYTSVNLNVDFLSSAKAGSTVTAHARIIRQGRNIIHAECHIYGDEGKLLAKGSSNLLVTQIKKPFA
jgi:uncharacterized protein (TIGR00369 family)